jgi:hypothetical protein
VGHFNQYNVIMHALLCLLNEVPYYVCTSSLVVRTVITFILCLGQKILC